MMHTLTQPADLIAQRVVLLRELAQSMDSSQFDIVRNDAEKIALGAARQAELCRQWSLLEDQLRLQSKHRQKPAESGQRLTESLTSAQLEQEFKALTARIRHLTRVHCSLLRHLQRSLAILVNVVGRCASTYTPDLTVVPTETRSQAGG